jgi:hypothetical protein
LKHFPIASTGSAAVEWALKMPTLESALGDIQRDLAALNIAGMRQLNDSASMVTSEFSSASLAADSWKNLHQDFSHALSILERLPMFEPETDSVIKHAIGVARSIVDQADQNYRSYSETARFEEIPKSFFAGLEDIQAGRVVDMERALNEPPPKRA